MQNATQSSHVRPQTTVSAAVLVLRSLLHANLSGPRDLASEPQRHMSLSLRSAIEDAKMVS